MKVLICGGYGIDFFGGSKPGFILDAVRYRDIGFEIKGSKLIAAGASRDMVCPEFNYFFKDIDVELITWDN